MLSIFSFFLKVFQVNTMTAYWKDIRERNITNRVVFSPFVTAQYIRLHLISDCWERGLGFELYGCKFEAEGRRKFDAIYTNKVHNAHIKHF